MDDNENSLDPYRLSSSHRQGSQVITGMAPRPRTAQRPSTGEGEVKSEYDRTTVGGSP